jgi:uncharacterized protein YndB with AHSA1/START domain
MSKPSFVYVTYIRSTPEKVWQALTAPEFTKKVWFGAVHQTDWKPGAAWKLILGDGRVADAGEIVECDPPRRLVIGNWQNQFKPELNAAGPTRCTIDIEPDGDAVKLTIVHVAMGDSGKLIEAVSGGWPKIVSNLKSLLETGELVIKEKVS